MAVDIIPEYTKEKYKIIFSKTKGEKMKKIKILGLLMVLNLLIAAKPCRADFFDGGPWYMAKNQWELFDAWDPEGRGQLTDANDRLNWITETGWTDNYDAFRAYGSRWAFDLSDDFEFTIGFHYDHTGNHDTDEGELQMGLVWFNDSYPTHAFSIAASNVVERWDGKNLSNKNVFFASMETPETKTDSWWRRNANDGMLYARYESSNDRLQFQTLEDNEATGGAQYSGLKQELGLNQLRVYLAGWSEGAGLVNGDAYFYNFEVHKGTIVPEPVSSILFVIGGAVFTFRRKRRKSS